MATDTMMIVMMLMIMITIHNSDDDSHNVAQAALHIQGVGRGDEGEYSCQVSTSWREPTFLQF